MLTALTTVAPVSHPARPNFKPGQSTTPSTSPGSRQRRATAARGCLAGRPHLRHGSGPTPAFDFCDGGVL